MIPALAGFKLQHAIPIPFLVTGFILAILCLTAGNKPGFMEEYALVRIDMSGLGNNLFTSSNDTSSEQEDEDDDEEDNDDDEEKDDDDGGINIPDINPFSRRRDIGDVVDGVGDKFDEAKDKVKDKVGEIGNEFIDGLAEDLGVKDWYSLHILTFCQGDFKNDTKNDTEANQNGFNIDECSKPSGDGNFNLTEVLGTDSLSFGPIDIPIPSGIERQLQKLYRLIQGLIFLYGMTIGCAFFASISSVLAVIWPLTYPYRFMRVNFALSSVAALSAMIASIATTIGITVIPEALGDIGEIIGVRVVKGWQFLAITWSMFGVVLVASVYWGVMYFKERRIVNGTGTDEIKEREKDLRNCKSSTKEHYKKAQHFMMGGQFIRKGEAGR